MRAALGLAAPEAAPPRRRRSFAVIAYGKLGGKELGYGSDLDVVFVYDDPTTSRRAAEVYGAFVRKLITWLTTAHRRPASCSTSTPRCGRTATRACWSRRSQSFENYQTRPRQQHRVDLGAPGADAGALVRRLRPALAPRFEAVRRAVLRAPRDAAALRARGAGDAREGARRASGARPAASTSSTAPGGMMDVEFAVQYLVLAHSARASPSCSTTSATSRCCSAPKPPACCRPASARAAADAYRELRRAQHRARLDEQPTQVDAGHAGRAARRGAARCGARCSADAAWHAGAAAAPGRGRRAARARRAAGWRSARDASALDWQPALALRAALARAGARRCVHCSALHLGANLAGARAGRRARLAARVPPRGRAGLARAPGR